MNFWDPSSNLHPYECDGKGACIHCNRKVTVDHDPETCELCKFQIDLLGPYDDPMFDNE